MDEEEGPSRIPVNLEGYNQTYLVEAVEPPSRDSKDEAEDEIDDEDAVHEHRVLFRCGNWCYTGHVAFDKRRIALSDIPRAIPMLQRQQNRLHYLCNANRRARARAQMGPRLRLARGALTPPSPNCAHALRRLAVVPRR